MVMAALIVFGAIMFARLNVDLFPEVDFPVVTVTVIYPGTDPATMETKVADPIEEAVNSLSGIKSLRSVSVQGVTQVFIEFELDVPLDVAAQDVRDQVASIQGDLPPAAERPLIEKLDIGAAPVARLAVSGPAGPAALARYAEDILKPGLESIRGVGQIELIGSREREVHVWVLPNELRDRGLTVLDVAHALEVENADVPGGRITQATRELVVRTNGEASSIEELAALPVTSRDDAVVRVGDVARVVDGLEEARSLARVDESDAIAVIIRKQSDANTVAVVDRLAAVLPELAARAPAETSVEILIDNSRRVRSSIESVQLDLVLGAILAVAIIFLFLRDPRATFISALALPTSVVGTFTFVNIMGFTLNMMTTLALSLSIGLLIDDAIVVIENIVRHRTELKEPARDAASRGTAEIGLAVLATTFSIVAVFVPVAFMEGMIGQFFYEFGLTVAFAVLLSLFVSFTLTPMLSARLLSDHHAEPRGLSARIESVLRATERSYRTVVRWALRFRLMTLVIAVVTLVGSFMLVPLIGFEFIPPQDTGQFIARVELPSGASLEQTTAAAARVAARVREMPGVVSTFTTVGGGAQEKVNEAEVVVSLVDKTERAFSQSEFMAAVRRAVQPRPDSKVTVEEIQAVSGGGRSAAPVQLNLRGNDLEELGNVANAIAEEMRGLRGFVDVDVSQRPGTPELNIDVDRARAADLGIAGSTIGATVRALIAGTVVTQFESGADRYDVRVQLPPELRRDAETVDRAQVRAGSGHLVDVESVADVREGVGASQIDRQARQRQVTILANLEDKALGDAVRELDAIVARSVPAHITTAYTGFAETLAESVSSMGFSLLLAIVCIYMLLASQFESFIQPVTIMVSLPFSLIGAFGGLLLADMRMSIFAMIGVIMLMGLVTKNAILLIDFTEQLRGEGKDMRAALEEAGAVRLRPILMTTAAMVFGMIPVAIGHGDGGEIRAPMGVCVIGGLITSTVLTLVVVPVVYTLMDTFSRLVARLAPKQRIAPQPAE